MDLRPVVNNSNDTGAGTEVASGLKVGVLSCRKYPGVGAPGNQCLILYSSWYSTGINLAAGFSQAEAKASQSVKAS